MLKIVRIMGKCRLKRSTKKFNGYNSYLYVVNERVFLTIVMIKSRPRIYIYNIKYKII